MATNYSTATIAADRGQRSFSLSLNQFLAKRGGSAIVARGRALKQSNAALLASIQQRFGVPPGPLLAIWGMETGFGSSRGNQNVLSAVATLAYDCRRTAYFTDHYAEPLLAKPPNESELRVDLINGSMIRLYGADNSDALRGPYLDGVVLDEFADMKPEVWHEVVRPMLADRHGWVTFIGTPKGKNEFWRLYESAKKDPAWFHMTLKASESGIISEGVVSKFQTTQFC
jgi:Transglycosylase SLT domain